MRKIVFERRVQEVQHQDAYFDQGSDAVARKGAYPIQKVTAALRLLAYGASADQLDEWIRLSESTILECLQRFIKAEQLVVNVWLLQFLLLYKRKLS
jgi:hypothetical protein